MPCNFYPTRSQYEIKIEGPTLADALVAAGRGFWIFPVAEYSKQPHPDIRSWPDAATCDLDEIRERGWPAGANIGIACKLSGLLVVDPDRHARDGVKAWTRLCEEHEADGDWPDTYTVRTPTNGYHLVFRNPGNQYGNGTGSLPKGIDVRGGGHSEGGYVLAAGSVVDRRAYEGKPELQQLVGDGRAYVVDHDAAVADPPGWLLGMLERTAWPSGSSITNTDTAGIWLTAKLTDAQLEDHLEQTITRLKTEAEGKRNDLLYWAAKRFGRAIALGRYDYEVAWDLLKDAGGELDLTKDEIKLTIGSGFKKVGAL